MDAKTWTRHIREAGATNNKEACDLLTLHLAEGCKTCKERRATRRANALRKQRDSVMRDCGMTRTPYGWE